MEGRYGAGGGRWAHDGPPARSIVLATQSDGVGKESNRGREPTSVHPRLRSGSCPHDHAWVPTVAPLAPPTRLYAPMRCDGLLGPRYALALHRCTNPHLHPRMHRVQLPFGAVPPTSPTRCTAQLHSDQSTQDGLPQSHVLTFMPACAASRSPFAQAHPTPALIALRQMLVNERVRSVIPVHTPSCPRALRPGPPWRSSP